MWHMFPQIFLQNYSHFNLLTANVYCSNDLRLKYAVASPNIHANRLVSALLPEQQNFFCPNTCIPETGKFRFGQVRCTYFNIKGVKYVIDKNKWKKNQKRLFWYTCDPLSKYKNLSVREIIFYCFGYWGAYSHVLLGYFLEKSHNPNEFENLSLTINGRQ